MVLKYDYLKEKSSWFMVLWVTGLLIFMKYWNSYLCLLLSVEMLMLLIFGAFIIENSFSSLLGSDLMMFLVLLVLGGAFGMTLLIYFSRQSMSDLFLSGFSF